MSLCDLVTRGRRPSLECGGRVYEPPELWRAVQARSEELLDCGLRNRDTVILNLELSDEYVLSLLAMISLDLVVVPTDSTTPLAVVEDIVQASQATALVGRGGVSQVGTGGESGLGAISPDLQYILFTSGSTGRPKGIMGTREGLANRVRWGRNEHYAGFVERIAVRTNPTFHDSLTEILCSVAADRRLVVAPASAQRDIGELVRFAHESQIDQLTVTPSTIPIIAQVAKRWPVAHVKRWIFSGEELRADWCRRVRRFSPSAEIINSYGSTEVTGDVAYFRLAADAAVPDPVPIGRIAPGVSWEIRASGPDPTPASVGELLVGGPQVALGYLNVAGQDKKSPAFECDISYDGGRRFRTGDMVQAVGDLLFYLGRQDDLVKVRGQRVDLNGVAAALESMPEVVEAAAWVDETNGMAALVAAVVLAEPRLAAETLLTQLRQRIPRHMVPDKVNSVSSLPRTVSGKVDRKAMSIHGSACGIARQEDFATGMEYAIAVALAEVMDNGGLRPQTILSDAGLDSLRSVVAAEKLSRIFGCRIDGVALRTLNTIRSIAVAVLHLQGQTHADAWRVVRKSSERQIVFIHPAIGTGLGYFPMIARLPTNLSVALVEQSSDATKLLAREGMDGLAIRYAELIRQRCSNAAVQLVGYSFGGVVLPAIANEFIRLGGSLIEPVLLDPRVPATREYALNDWALRRVLSDSGYGRHLPSHQLSTDEALRVITNVPGHLKGVTRGQVEHWSDSLQANSQQVVGYEPPKLEGPATVVSSTTADAVVGELSWLARSIPHATVVQMRCSHYELLRPPNVSDISELIAKLAMSTNSGVGIEESDGDR